MLNRDRFPNCILSFGREERRSTQIYRRRERAARPPENGAAKWKWRLRRQTKDNVTGNPAGSVGNLP